MTLLIVIALLIIATCWLLYDDSRAAPKHYGHPQTWFTRHAPDAAKQRILEGRIKHASDVARFFANHPRLAHTKHGRAAAWQHRRMGRWAAGRLREVRRVIWLTLPAPNDWVMAVRVAQRPFPGTASWLLSCSAAEGSHGAWVRYGGGAYYPGYERTDAVGSWLQFRPSTFRVYYHGALKTARARGFKVPLSDSWLKGWLSPLGVALTGGYMRHFGKDGHHWSASHGRGC